MTPADRAQRRLHDLADRLEPGLRRAFLAMAASLTPESLAELVRLLEAGDLDGAVAYLTGSPRAIAAVTLVRSTFAGGIIRTIGAIAKDVTLGDGGRRLVIAAPVASPDLIAAVRRWEDGAFARVLVDVRAGLRETIATELQRGIGPKQVAVQLKQGVGAGLTDYDSTIVRNFRRELESGRFSDAKRRALRDRRYALPKGKPLTPKQIDTMVAAYERKLVAFRAETFARTAAMQAANEASDIGWREAIAQGLVPAAEVRRYWVVAADERLCEVCAPIPGLNNKGVNLDGLFTTPNGPMRCPPVHPNCRCTTWIRRERVGVRPAPQPGTTRLILTPA